MTHVFEQRLVLFAQCDPIVAVHVRHIEPIAITAPHFVEDLVPLFDWNSIDIQSSGRNCFARFIACGRRIVKVVTLALANKHFRTIVRKSVAANVVGQCGFFAILYRKYPQRCVAIALTAVIRSPTYNVQQVPGLRGQSEVVVSSNRHTRDTICNTVEVDRHGCRRFRGGFGFRFSSSRCFGGFLGRRSCRLGRFLSFGDRHLIALGRKGMLDIFPQSHRVDVSRAISCIVEFNIRKLRREFSVTQEIEIVALWIPCGIVGVEVVVSYTMQLAIVRIPNKHGRKLILIRHREREEVSSRRPRVIANLTAR